MLAAARRFSHHSPLAFLRAPLRIRFFSNSSVSSPTDYLKTFISLVHPDRFAGFSRFLVENPEKAENPQNSLGKAAETPESPLTKAFFDGLLSTNSHSLAQLNNLISYFRSAKKIADFPREFQEISVNFYFLAEEKRKIEDFQGIPIKREDFRDIQQTFQFSSRSPAFHSLVWEKGLYSLYRGVGLEIPVTEELEWMRRWEKQEEKAEKIGEKEESDPLLNSLDSSLRSRARENSSLRGQLKNLRNLGGPALNIQQTLKWSENEETSQILEAMMENQLIEFPESFSPLDEMAAVQTLGRRLATPLARAAVHAWMGVSVHFIENTDIRCTRTDWFLPISMSNQEFHHFLLYWIREFQLQGKLIKTEKNNKKKNPLE